MVKIKRKIITLVWGKIRWAESTDTEAYLRDRVISRGSRKTGIIGKYVEKWEPVVERRFKEYGRT